MYNCNGVVTEKRFQDMSLMQWIYHYKIIEKKKKEETKYRHSLIKSVAEELTEVYKDTTLDQTEMLSLFIDKKLFKRYQEFKKQADKEESKQEMSLEEEWAMLENEPEVISVDIPEKEKKKSPLKTISKKKFVGIKRN